VTEAAGQTVTGTLVELTPTHLTMRVKGSQRSFTPDMIAEVQSASGIPS
jgi:hypothetical protein